MKSNLVKKSIYSSILLFALTNSALANHPAAMGPAMNNAPGKLYVGVFGGGGSTGEVDVNQFGSAYYFEAVGGPVAVNALGHIDHHTGWLVGGQVGYQVQSALGTDQWSISPAAELEAFYMGKRDFSGEVINDTVRLPEHDFIVTYPMSRAVFLTNVVFNLNIPCMLFHPYAGFGFGGAVVKIRGADSLQIGPPEADVNHYNSSTSDTSPTFAGQIKLGFSYDVTDCISLFAEYRWLYLSSTQFAFGSTVYPGHPETTFWHVKLDRQSSNLGTVGIRVNL